MKTCYDTLNGLSSNLNETDRHEYASHIRFELKSLFSINTNNFSICSFFSSVEHQIADIKQRLIHFEQLSIEHQNEYRNFEKNLQLFELNINNFKQTIESDLMQVTINNVTKIDVSF